MSSQSESMDKSIGKLVYVEKLLIRHGFAAPPSLTREGLGESEQRANKIVTHNVRTKGFLREEAGAVRRLKESAQGLSNSERYRLAISFRLLTQTPPSVGRQRKKRTTCRKYCYAQCMFQRLPPGGSWRRKATEGECARIEQ